MIRALVHRFLRPRVRARRAAIESLRIAARMAAPPAIAPADGAVVRLDAGADITALFEAERGGAAIVARDMLGGPPLMAGGGGFTAKATTGGLLARAGRDLYFFNDGGFLRIAIDVLNEPLVIFPAAGFRLHVLAASTTMEESGAIRVHGTPRP